MSITSLNSGGANSLLLQQLLGSLSAGAVDQTDGIDAAGSADSTGQAGDLTLPPPAPPPAPPSDGQPSDLFNSDTLGALTTTQADASSSTTDPASGGQIADSLASLMMQYADASYSSQAATATAQTSATSITA